MSEERLKFIFGENAEGGDVWSYARTSDRRYVRSQDQIAFYSEDATGQELTALVVYEAYGLRVLERIAEEGVTVLIKNELEPAINLKRQRESMGLSQEDVAALTKFSTETVRDAEDPDTRTQIVKLIRIARVLGLNTYTFLPKNDEDKLIAKTLAELMCKTGDE